MGITRRSDRPDPARRKSTTNLEALESRTVLSLGNHPFAPWIPSDLPVQNPITHQKIPYSIAGQVAAAQVNPQAELLNNEGKVVSGKDRAGNEWAITVHGPGEVIVTDTTPNDGALDDNIDTIQLVGTNPNKTYVTGNTTASAYTPTNGVVFFNKLIDVNGVKSVVLNGFTLSQTVVPTTDVSTGGVDTTDTGVYLLGGVGFLQFHDILAPIDQASADTNPINIVIGDPSTPLKVQPTIKLDSIFNTVFDSNASTVPTNPLTTPTVNIVVNGTIESLSFISSTQAPTVDPTQSLRAFVTTGFWNPDRSPIFGAGEEFAFPTVGTTGRTAIRANAINNLRVAGSPINVTASKGTVPFQNSLSGLNHVGTVNVGGNADAFGVDVNGKVNRVVFHRGLGNPAGTGPSATEFGTPTNFKGYPASGLLGGLVTASHIGKIIAKPANVHLQTAQNPDFVHIPGKAFPAYFPRAGNALTSSAIVSAGSINRTVIVGDTVNSEIKSGFHYPSFAAGLEGTRAPSTLGPVHQRGNLVNGVVSATFRPTNHIYSSATGVKGPGTITGRLNGNLYTAPGTTALGNQGTGFFARTKIGYLPPPSRPTRNAQGIVVR
jgi:hypothetical protein